jgi:hypothetical protein
MRIAMTKVIVIVVRAIVFMIFSMGRGMNFMDLVLVRVNHDFWRICR